MLQLGGQDQTLTNNEMGILPLCRAAAAAAPNSGELEAGWRHLLLLPSEDMDQETIISKLGGKVIGSNELITSYYSP
jgi:hypothetical protein